MMWLAVNLTEYICKSIIRNMLSASFRFPFLPFSGTRVVRLTPVTLTPTIRTWTAPTRRRKRNRLNAAKRPRKGQNKRRKKKREAVNRNPNPLRPRYGLAQEWLDHLFATLSIQIQIQNTPVEKDETSVDLEIVDYTILHSKITPSRILMVPLPYCPFSAKRPLLLFGFLLCLCLFILVFIASPLGDPLVAQWPSPPEFPP